MTSDPVGGRIGMRKAETGSTAGRGKFIEGVFKKKTIEGSETEPKRKWEVAVITEKGLTRVHI